MRIARSTVLFPFLVFGLLTLGCTPGERPEYGCVSDDVCAVNEICKDQHCIQVECTLDKDCLSGSGCMDHRCLQKPGCESDRDCDGGTVCQAKTCVCGARAWSDCLESAVWWFDTCGNLDELITDCQRGCLDGKCLECVGDCSSRDCGPDPLCGESCGTCSGGKECRDGVCLCQSHVSQACFDGDLYWQDSCGAFEELAADCPNGCQDQKCLSCSPDCSNRQCGPEPLCGESCGTCGDGKECRDGVCLCRSHVSQACFDGDLYWQDSCGAFEELAADCPNGCADGGCLLCHEGEIRCWDGKLYRCAADRKSFSYFTKCGEDCLDDRRCASPAAFFPASTFVMGSDSGEGENDERPERTVSLDSFFLDLFEVTNAEYAECVAVGACTPPASPESETQTSYYGNPAFELFPVVNANWYQAREYCLSHKGRLPSEAEWERAARGSSPSEQTYPWGEAEPDCSLSNREGCAGDTRAVGSLPGGATVEGLHDLAGNVYEWVQDWYGEGYYGGAVINNPLGPSAGTKRVSRGGGFKSEKLYIRSANRAAREPVYFATDFGFRCARSVSDGDHDRDGFTPAAGDCNDGDANSFPEAKEVCWDGLDNDCDGLPDDGCENPISGENAQDVPIPDNGPWAISSVYVPAHNSLSQVQAEVHISHTYIGDLQVVLVHPDRSTFTIHNNTGGSADNIDRVYSVNTFIGKTSAGVWMLQIRDTASGDTGTLTSWSLTLN